MQFKIEYIGDLIPIYTFSYELIVPYKWFKPGYIVIAIIIIFVSILVQNSENFETAISHQGYSKRGRNEAWVIFPPPFPSF